MWTRLLSPFSCGRRFRGGERKRRSHLCRRRKGGGRDLAVIVPSRPDRRQLDTEGRQGRVEGWMIDPHSKQMSQEGGLKDVHRLAWESGEVLMPNRPGFRLSWPPSNPRSHPWFGRASHLDSLCEALPGTGIGSGLHSWRVRGSMTGKGWTGRDTREGK